MSLINELDSIQERLGSCCTTGGGIVAIVLSRIAERNMIYSLNVVMVG